MQFDPSLVTGQLSVTISKFYNIINGKMANASVNVLEAL